MAGLCIFTSSVTGPWHSRSLGARRIEKRSTDQTICGADSKSQSASVLVSLERGKSCQQCCPETDLFFEILIPSCHFDHLQQPDVNLRFSHFFWKTEPAESSTCPTCTGELCPPFEAKADIPSQQNKTLSSFSNWYEKFTVDQSMKPNAILFRALKKLRNQPIRPQTSVSGRRRNYWCNSSTSARFRLVNFSLPV